jgi:serine/threonine protein kinase
MTGVGTLLYKAPELFCEEQKYSMAVDVYAYGMILYELVTYSRPWSREFQELVPLDEIISKLRRGERPRIPDTVSADYKGLIKRCWAQDPNDRPFFKDIVDKCKGGKLFFPLTDRNGFEEYVEKLGRHEGLIGNVLE